MLKNNVINFPVANDDPAEEAARLLIKLRTDLKRFIRLADATSWSAIKANLPASALLAAVLLAQRSTRRALSAE
jgi:hypothetical protein